MKRGYRRFRSVLTIMFIIALAAAAIVRYISSVKSSLWDQTALDILEVSKQGTHAFEVYIEKDMQILTRIVKHLVAEDSASGEGITDTIRSFEDGEAEFTVIDLEHGIMYNGSEQEGRQLGADEVAQYALFAQKQIRESYVDEDTGEMMIGGYERFQFADGADGIVQVKRQVDVVREEFMLSFYDYHGFSYLVNREGDIVLCSSDQSNETIGVNLFEAMRRYGNSESTVESFCESMLQNGEGVMQFGYAGEEFVFAYTPVEGTEGWYLVAIVPQGVIMKHADKILKSAQGFMLMLGGIALTAGLFLYMRRRSDRKLMEKEEEVRYREQLFDILANNTDDVFLMFTADHYAVEYVSPNVERVLGITREEVKNDIRGLEIVRMDEGKKLSYSDVEELEAGASIVYEGERIHKKSGEPRWFLETTYKRDVNGSERYITVLSDRTNERRSEETLRDALAIAKSANASKSIFLSNMSHDIRTPMNAIIGLSTLLQRDAHNSDKVKEHTRKITASSQHLLGLINDVLDMSKIESGKATLNVSDICLAQIIEELGTMIQPQARAKGQEFKIDVYDINNEEVVGDRLRINQILINILSNAVKYTPEGGRIEMIVRQIPQYSKNYARYHFIVRDNGIGMSQEYLADIFHPFTRENTAKSAEIQGTGLGMAITKNLVDLMGGTIQVESAPGVGTTFTVDLELRIKEQNVDPEFWMKHGVTKLLVVDDEEEICVGIRNIMADTGIEIQYALSGLSAVQMAEEAMKVEQGFDMVLIDWQMPDISGVETARQMRKIVPAQVPILILTAYDIDSIEKQGIEVGIDGFLQKPFFLSNFRMVVQNMKGGAGRHDAGSGQEEVLAGKHILIAEDNELNSEILLELLAMTGAVCDLARNGKEALTMFESSMADRYDVILMDVQMPVMNGYEATGAIRTCSHPQAETIPIIAMTANAFAEDIKDALDAGMNEHVAKPVDMERLKAVIREVTS